MLKTRPKRRAWIWAIAATALLASVVYSSASLQSCIVQPQNCAAQQSPNENIASFFEIAESYRGYGREFVSKHRDAILAILAVFLAFCTILVWVFRRGADRAAKAPARYIPNIERARVNIVIEAENISRELTKAANSLSDDGVNHIGIVNLGIQYSLKNYGKTAALIREIGHCVTIQDTLPEEPRYTALVPLPVDHALGADDKSTGIKVESIPAVSVGTANSIQNMENTFWFCGYVIYDDIFGWRRTLNFVWHYGAVSSGLSLFSYRETEKKREN